MRAETTPSLPRRGGRTRIQRHADQAPTPVGKGIVREPRQKSKAERFPIIVAEWPRNSRELVRITLDRFKNHFTIDQRAWWQDTNGVFKPGRSGLTLGVSHLATLAHALNKPLQHAEMLGLVEPVARRKDRTAAERQRRCRHRRNGANGSNDLATVTRNDQPQGHSQPRLKGPNLGILTEGNSPEGTGNAYWTPVRDDREPGPMLADQLGSGAAGTKHR